MTDAIERDAPLTQVSDSQLGSLRLCTPEALMPLERSLRRHGQLEPIVVFEAAELLEVIDGFKRLHVARRLGWHALRVRVRKLEVIEAKLLLVEVHTRRALTALEEGWLIRSLVRDHRLSQGYIAERLGRHKSWVWRRLLLVEQLAPQVQAQVRLGLLVPRAAMAVAALPRGNQKPVADVVAERGLTVRQTEVLVAGLLDCGDITQLPRLLSRHGNRKQGPSVRKAAARLRSEADWTCQDVLTLRTVAARLESRLLNFPLSSFGEGPAELIDSALVRLLPILEALQVTIRGAIMDPKHQERSTCAKRAVS